MPAGIRSDIKNIIKHIIILTRIYNSAIYLTSSNPRVTSLKKLQA